RCARRFDGGGVTSLVAPERVSGRLGRSVGVRKTGRQLVGRKGLDDHRPTETTGVAVGASEAHRDTSAGAGRGAIECSELGFCGESATAHRTGSPVTTPGSVANNAGSGGRGAATEPKPARGPAGSGRRAGVPGAGNHGAR